MDKKMNFPGIDFEDLGIEEFQTKDNKPKRGEVYFYSNEDYRLQYPTITHLPTLHQDLLDKANINTIQVQPGETEKPTKVSTNELIGIQDSAPGPSPKNQLRRSRRSTTCSCSTQNDIKNLFFKPAVNPYKRPCFKCASKIPKNKTLNDHQIIDRTLQLLGIDYIKNPYIAFSVQINESGLLDDTDLASEVILSNPKENENGCIEVGDEASSSFENLINPFNCDPSTTSLSLIPIKPMEISTIFDSPITSPSSDWCPEKHEEMVEYEDIVPITRTPWSEHNYFDRTKYEYNEIIFLDTPAPSPCPSFSNISDPETKIISRVNSIISNPINNDLHLSDHNYSLRTRLPERRTSISVSFLSDAESHRYRSSLISMVDLTKGEVENENDGSISSDVESYISLVDLTKGEDENANDGNISSDVESYISLVDLTKDQGENDGSISSDVESYISLVDLTNDQNQGSMSISSDAETHTSAVDLINVQNQGSKSISSDAETHLTAVDLTKNEDEHVCINEAFLEMLRGIKPGERNKVNRKTDELVIPRRRGRPTKNGGIKKPKVTKKLTRFQIYKNMKQLYDVSFDSKLLISSPKKTKSKKTEVQSLETTDESNDEAVTCPKKAKRETTKKKVLKTKSQRSKSKSNNSSKLKIKSNCKTVESKTVLPVSESESNDFLEDILAGVKEYEEENWWDVSSDSSNLNSDGDESTSGENSLKPISDSKISNIFQSLKFNLNEGVLSDLGSDADEDFDSQNKLDLCNTDMIFKEMIWNTEPISDLDSDDGELMPPPPPPRKRIKLVKKKLDTGKVEEPLSTLPEASSLVSDCVPGLTESSVSNTSCVDLTPSYSISETSFSSEFPVSISDKVSDNGLMESDSEDDSGDIFKVFENSKSIEESGLNVGEPDLDLISDAVASNVEVITSKKQPCSIHRILQEYLGEDISYSGARKRKFHWTKRYLEAIAPALVDPNPAHGETDLVMQCSIFEFNSGGDFEEKLKHYTYKKRFWNKPTAEIEVLSSTKLHELRAYFHCLKDCVCTVEAREYKRSINGGGFSIKDLSCNVNPEWLFEIENSVLLDKSNGRSVELAERLLNYYNDRPRLNIPPKDIVDTRNITLGNLSLRFGFPYIYIHQGGCKHYIVFHNARLANPGEINPYSTFPRYSEPSTNPPENGEAGKTYKAKKLRKMPKRVLCSADCRNSAQWAIKNCEYFIANTGFLCSRCIRLLLCTKLPNGQYQLNSDSKAEVYRVLQPANLQEFILEVKPTKSKTTIVAIDENNKSSELVTNKNETSEISSPVLDNSSLAVNSELPGPVTTETQSQPKTVSPKRKAFKKTKVPFKKRLCFPKRCGSGIRKRTKISTSEEAQTQGS